MTSPIYRFHDGEGTRTIDLRSVQSIYRYDGRTVWTVDGAGYLFDVPASVGKELDDAWIAYNNGEHAPTPAVGVPGLPELPGGWAWHVSELHTEARNDGCVLRVAVRGKSIDVVVSVSGLVRADVVEMTIARHRARAGGAA